MDGSFLDFSIKQILELYRERKLSPVDVAEMCIRQVEHCEPDCHAWVRFDPERLLKAAKQLESTLDYNFIRGLEGIPVGVKDIFNTNEFPTEMGSPLWKDFTPGNDARVVYYLRQAGALIPGKTVTAEFAVHTLGKTLNPHNSLYSPGTSSSGSAAAVASGMVPAALGTQTAGSIVRPASFCGIYGYKPSFGLVPRTGMLKTTDSLDTVGYFVSHFEDIQRLFEIIRVRGRNFPISDRALNDPERQNKPGNRPWKIAFVKTHVWNEAPKYAQDEMGQWCKKLSAHHDIEVEEIELPSITTEAHRIHEIIYNKTLCYYFEHESKQAEFVSPIMNQLISLGRKITPQEYQDALRQQEQLAKAVDQFAEKYDAIIALSTAGEAPLREETEKPDSALLWNLAHLPTMAAPAFVSPSGLPYGVQIIARRYNDYRLLEFANLLNENEFIPSAGNPKPGLQYSGHKHKQQKNLQLQV